jgi:chromosome partitioning protein
MRIDGRTNGAAVLRQWADAIGVPFLGHLRETQLYARALEKGLTIFDLAPSQIEADLVQWQPVLDWLDPVVSPPIAANDGAPMRTPVNRIAASRPDALMPAQESLVHGTRLVTTLQRVAEHRAQARTLEGSRTLVPQFLKR